MEQNKVLIQLNNASFRYPGEDYLFENLKLTVKEGDKTALVGANGSGKSTLLKILTGSIQLEEGNFFSEAKSYYVPQIDLTIQQKDSPIYEYISQYYEEWWDVLPTLDKMFGLSLDTEKTMGTLSGGELMKLNLSIAIKHNPDVLILDEPTNHLDIKSINTLVNFINDPKNKFTFLLVSHDTMFLDKVVNHIWELENKKITAYGGNYTFYKEQKELHLRGIRKQYELAKEKLERTQELEQREIEKQAKRANEAKRAFIKGSIDKRRYGAGKDAASSLQSTKSAVVERLMDDAAEKLEEFETEERKLAFINLKNTSENANRTIFELKEANLELNGKELLKGIKLRVAYGDRIVISGDNGSGKTSLVKALLNKVNNTSESNVELTGDVYVGDNLAWVYIDQHYSLIKPDLDLIQNLMASHPSITESKAKEQLGKFQFKNETEMHKLGKNLSGGEMVRVIMAMITAFPIDLIILDEPTNNLDVETVEVLSKSLNQFRGAIIVISHNVDFLASINIKTAYLIKDKKLKTLEVQPSNKEAFYNTLIA